MLMGCNVIWTALLLNRTGFVGDNFSWEKVPMTKPKYTPEIKEKERAVRLLVKPEKDYIPRLELQSQQFLARLAVLLNNFVPGIKCI